MKLLSAYYGIPDKMIDITEKLIPFCRINRIYLGKNINLNNFVGDPAPGTPKKIQLKIEHNNIVHEFDLSELNCKLTQIFDTNDHDFKSFKSLNIKHNVLMITHGFGGGTDKFIDDIIMGNEYPNIHYQLIKPQFCGNNLPQCDFIHINALLCHGPSGYCLNINMSNLIKNYKIANKTDMILTIHDYQWIYPTNPTPEFIWLENNVPTIININMCEEIFNVCNKIVFPTNTLYLYYKQYIPSLTLNPNKVSIVPNPDLSPSIFNHQFIPKLFNKNIIKVGILGYLSHIKGHDYVCEIAKKMPNINFIIIGNALPIIALPNVIETGPYQNKNIFELIKKNDIHILWYSGIASETWSYTLTVGIATGLPLFYNNIGAYKERLNKITYPHYYCYYKDDMNIICQKLNHLIEKIKTEQDNAQIYIENKWSNVASNWYQQVYFRSYISTCLKKEQYYILHNTSPSTNDIRPKQFIKSYMNIFALHAQYLHSTIFSRKSQSLIRGIIIETRLDYYETLLHTLWNFIYYCGSQVNLTIVTNEKIYDYLQKSLPFHSEIDYKIVNNLMEHEIYDNTLMDINMLKNIKENILFIFKTGGIILRPFSILEFYHKHPHFIGPPRTKKLLWNKQLINLKTPKGINIDGSISIRNKSDMITCLEKITYENINTYRELNKMNKIPFIMEDVYYYTAMEFLGMKLPNFDECQSFGISDSQTYGNGYPYLTLCGYMNANRLKDQEYLDILNNLDYNIVADYDIKNKWKNLWIIANFDWQFYLKANPDLLNGGIFTFNDALMHFYKHGYEENRYYYDDSYRSTYPPKYF